MRYQTKAQKQTLAAKLAAVGVALICSAQAHSNIFVDIAGIEGDSTNAAYRNTIDAVNATGNFSSRGCGVFRVEKELDSATPQLIAAIVNGIRFPEADIIYTANSTSAGTIEYLRMTLNNVRITKLRSSTEESEQARPTEVVSIKAESVDVTYTPRDERGGAGTPIVESVVCGDVK